MTRMLLFEVGTEELPPSELPGVLAALEENAGRELGDARLGFASLRVYSTPRRLTLLVDGLEEQQATFRTRVTGPPRKAAFDATGRPTKAAEGFARAQGVTVADLVTIATDRGEYLAADRTEPGRPAADVLPDLLTRLMTSLPFAKQMRWGDGEVRFSRPVRWVVAMLDDVVLSMTFLGIPAGRTTYGHRFLHPAPITLAHARDWLSALDGARVMPDLRGRRDAVRGAVETAAGAISQRAVVDDATLETVLHLVEAPAAVVGTFAESYLELPRQVVETPIRRHQKCFVVERADGTLAPAFVAVSNMPGGDATEIRRGNERVIRARLADADFYFREDRKIRPEERLPLLAGMVFQERLGTLKDKTDRLVQLVEHVADVPADRLVILRRAALLAKTDLASGMVREFPELEGLMGEEYARRAGEPDDVARAIGEHYLPRSADGRLPRSDAGALLGIADKVDTIVGCLGVGLIPSGSQDPYALRRQAQGVVQIMLERGDRFSFSLGRTIGAALALLEAKLVEPHDVTRQRALDFFKIRLATILAARSFRPDVVEAVLAAGFDVPSQALRRVEAVTALMKRPDWDPLVITFKRAINILPAGFSGAGDPSRFVHDAERRLHEETAGRCEQVLAALGAGRYEEALAEVAALRPAVDTFFEAVLVMDKDPAIQANRLALLRAIADLLLPVADLRKIQAVAAA